MAYTFQQVDSNTVNVFSSNGSLVARTSIANAQQNYGYTGGAATATTSAASTPATPSGSSGAAAAAGTPIDVTAVDLANASKQGVTSYNLNGRTWYKQADGSWSNGVDAPISAATVASAANAVPSGGGWVIPATTSASSTQAETPTVQSVQSQLSDLQAQQAALTQYGLTDTNQLTKDASGNYVPISTAQTTTPASVNSQVTAAQTQLASLQAQQAALKTYNLTDTNQLTQDANGNWVPNTQSMNTILSNMGLSAATIAQLTPAQQVTMATVGGIISSQYTQNNPVPSTFTAADLDALMTQAQNDPTISQYYGGQLKIAQTEFMNAFNLLSASTNTQMAETQRQQAVAMKNLQNQEATAGMAYSGFRKQATEQLSQSQESVIESSKQQLQSQLNDLGSSFEKQFGSSAIPPMGSIQGESYQPIGGVTGTEASAEEQDVTNKYNELVNKAALTRGISAPNT